MRVGSGEMLPRWTRRAAPLLALLATAVCARERAGGSTSREGETALLDAPPPPPPASLSRFVVPLEYDFRPVLRLVEKAVPVTFGSLDSIHPIGDDDHRRFAFVARRTPFRVTVTGSTVHFRTTVSYSARVYYKPPIGPTIRASCGTGDDRPQIVVDLDTPIALDSAWRLKPAITLHHLVPQSDSTEDRCRLSLFRIDVTDRVVNAAQQAIAERLPEIDRRVAEVSLEEKATQWWAALNRPIRLTDGVWLLLHPRQLRVGRVTGTRTTLAVHAGLDALPSIVMADDAPEVEAPPLPPLGRDTSDTGFEVLVEGSVDYATASRMVTEELRGKAVTQGGRTVTVDSVVATPEAGGRLALAVSFSGDAAGTLRLVGTPTYDAASGIISVPDIDYDLETDNALVNAFAWLKSDALRAMIRDRAHVQVGSQIDRGRDLLVEGLNRTIGGVLTLSAEVDSVGVVGIYVTSRSLLVRASAFGAVRAKVSARE